jgi:hypothetical protein
MRSLPHLWVHRSSAVRLASVSRPPRRGRNTFRPEVEALEPRRTPTVTFAAQQTFAVTGPGRAVAADFNGDGRPDLAAANTNNNTVSVLLNIAPIGSATASFAASQTFAAGTAPGPAVAADFNGDGRPDLAVADFGSGAGTAVAVLLNTTAAGANTFSFAAAQTFALGASPQGLATADLNGDGRPDLAAVNHNDKTVSVLLNTTPAGSGTPAFAAQQTFATGDGPDTVAAADLNGDGRPDLVVGNGNANTVSVLLNTAASGAASPSFAAQKTFAVVSNPTAVAAADLNGDGRPDLAVANFFTSQLSVLVNTTAAGAGTPAFAAQQTFAVNGDGVAVAAGDLDGDGRPDLAVTGLSSDSAGVLVNTTAAGAAAVSFAAQQTFATGGGPSSVAVADYNGDGRPDLAVTDNSSVNGDRVSVLVNTTAPFFNTTPVVVGQFGTTGVWRFNQTTNSWVQLTVSTATRLAADPLGDVAGEFQGAGVWLFRPSSGWHQIGTGDASALAMDANGDVAGSFPGAGVWLFRPAVGFQQIGTGDASALAMDALGDVVGTFPGHGVWLFRPAVGFQQIGGGDASVLTMDGLGDVIGAFPGAGVWEFRPTVGFQKINATDATALAADPYGNLVANFGGVGIGQYQPSVGWRLFLPSSATALGMDALGDVFGAFAGYGVWEAGAFRFGMQLRSTDASLLVVA